MWAGKDWEQSPPELATYATDMQERAWHLKMGIATRYAQGSTPERIIQSSQLLGTRVSAASSSSRTLWLFRLPASSLLEMATAFVWAQH